MRLVSLACSNTEIVCALGCETMLVGVDDHSDYPAEVVRRLPRLGPDLTPDIDRVGALAPDLVLASLTVPGHERVIERLEAAGLDYLAPAPESLHDVLRDVETIGARLGVPQQARTLVDGMRRALSLPERHDLAKLGSRVEPQAPSILVEWWPKPVIAPGRRSWIHDLIALAGGRNPLAAEDMKSRPLHDREVAELRPDAIVVSWCGVPFARYRPEVVYRNPAWQEVPALRSRQVHCIPEAFLGRPSPRLVEGYRALRAVVEAVKAVRSVADTKIRPPCLPRASRAQSRRSSSAGGWWPRSS